MSRVGLADRLCGQRMPMSDDQAAPVEPDLRDDAEVDALLGAGGEQVDEEPDGMPDIEGPNSA